MPSLPNIAGSRLGCRLFSSVRVRCWWDLCDGGWVDCGWWWGLRRFFFQISNTYFLGTENVPYQPLTIFERVAFIGHWNVRPHANPTIITLSPLSEHDPTLPFSIPLSPFKSHYHHFNPTLCASIPLFRVYIYYPTTTLLVYTPNFQSSNPLHTFRTLSQIAPLYKKLFTLKP